MRLPNAAAAHVDPKKITGYLLSPDHPVGRYKYRYFKSAGFRMEEPDVLLMGLRRLAREGLVREAVRGPHGTKYIVDGMLHAPDGEAVAVRTVWITPVGTDVPSFVTAFPVS